MDLRERLHQTATLSPAAEAWVSVVVAGDYLTRQSDAVCARHGITGDQYNVLRILRGARAEGRSRGEISHRMMRRSPDMTRMLDRLERRGLIVRTKGSDDARRSVARITREGLAILDRIDPEIAELMGETTRVLSPVQLRQIVRLCGALVR